MSVIGRLALLVLATLVSYPLGLALGQAWLLPLLNMLPAYVTMLGLLRRGDRQGAVMATLVWALALAVFATISFALWPVPPDALVLRGPAYRGEMFHWILTGEGSEGDVRLFLPQHLAHLFAFVALSLVTASAVSIFMGAVLMNYMAFYVASLARAGVPTATVVLFGWQPWAICRVAGFCILGAVLAEPLLARARPYSYAGLKTARPYLLWAAGLMLADWILKGALAPTWGLTLRDALASGSR
jgi:hypothetical protein